MFDKILLCVRHSASNHKKQLREKEMEKSKRIVSILCTVAMLLAILMGAGCATKGQTGALTGAGAGALVGGLANMHGSWGATALIGAGVGAGIGYLIGNEEDKKDAMKRQAVREDETRPLAGTTWQVISINPKPKTTSIVAHFKSDGTVITKTNGRYVKLQQKHSGCGSTLIINKPDYVETPIRDQEQTDYRLRKQRCPAARVIGLITRLAIERSILWAEQV
jgi:hypothetical protein